MINNDRIVPIQKIDLISMYGTILGLGDTDFDVIAPTDTEGNFAVTGSGAVGAKLANQPVKTLDFGEGITTASVYFVPAYDFEGITVNGAKSYDEASETVNPDGVTLYVAGLASGEVTVTAITPSIA